ncbi:MAG TPA: amidase family protein [Acidimicrobiia bacterium]|nr:amidase family protein [Acidimicrobiia bacterium]
MDRPSPAGARLSTPTPEQHVTDLATLDATAQAALVRTGDASPAELVDAAIDRIERVDPAINAVVSDRFERARDDARSPALPDGPFRGVPFLLKDLGCPMRDEPSHEGMRALKDAGYRATFDSALVRRIKDAGLVVLGRTNTPELGIMATTEPASYGPTRNPWDTERTPGGSSGGAAAAVAAGLVPFAHASDGGGSIRIPASCCGLVGLKPSRGRVSLAPAGGELARFLSIQLCVARSVRDVAAFLDVASGEEPGDPMTAPPPRHPFVDEVGVDPGRLRIGVMTTLPGSDSPVSEPCVRAVDTTAKLLESLGHHVEVSHPAALDDADRISSFMAVWSTLQAVALDAWGATLGRTLGPDDVEPLTWELSKHGGDIRAVDYVASITAMQAFARRIAQWWADGFDLLLTSTLGEVPPALGVLSTPDEPLAGYARAATFTPYTPIYNQTGQPAISVPVAHDDATNLPVGVQLVAAYGREDLLLRVAAQLEQAIPWADRRPPVHA